MAKFAVHTATDAAATTTSATGTTSTTSTATYAPAASSAGVAAAADPSPTTISTPTTPPPDAVTAALAAATPTGAAPPATPTTAPVPTPPATSLPTPAHPLLDAAGRLRTLGNGTHEMTLQLHPADLGAVDLTARIRDGALTVTVAVADAGAHDAVTSALPGLRQELADAGFSSVDVSVGGQARPDQQSDQQSGQASRGQSHSPPTDDQSERHPPTPQRRSARDANLDRWL